jgi:Tfp pilus assembly protein PilO
MTSPRSFARQLLDEHRRLVLVLLAVLAANVVLFVLVVYPLSQRVANVEERNQSAEQSLAAARQEFARADGTLTGKDRASTELATFYEDVLPTDLAGARRATQLRLRQLARESNLEFERDTYEPVADRGSSLTRLRIGMVLSGSYADIRSFIYELETAPEFVVTDNVELTEGADGGSLVVTLELSTYFRGQP